MKIFLNNKFVKASKAKISILEQGYQYGYGVFDTLRTYNGKISNIDAHLKRLYNSAKKINLEIPLSKKEIKNDVNKLIKKNDIKNKKIKIMVAKGIKKSTISIVFSNMNKYEPIIYKKGVSVITTKYQRTLPDIKSMNYLPCLLAIEESKKKNAFEALLIDNNQKITEGTFSNLFIVKNDKLITAKDNVLKGITRHIVLKLAKPIFKKIVLKNLSKEEIYKADEAFLSVTTGEIIPISSIDNRKIKIGKYTKIIADKYKKHIKNA
jgi:branched-chain amino acid aminotransferase